MCVCVCLASVSNYRLTVGVGTALSYGGEVAASPLLMCAIITHRRLGLCWPLTV